jgi:hypothetical protein
MGNPETIQLSSDPLVHELSRLGAQVQRLNKPVKCPFHDDQHPSASVHQGKDGVWRLYCFTEGKSWDVFDLRAAADGKPLDDVLREFRKANPAPSEIYRPPPEEPPTLYDSMDAITAIVPGKLEKRYDYTNPDTREVELAVWRFIKAGEKKQFWQGTPWNGTGKWVLRGLTVNPLYNRSRLRLAQKVIVCEGEKKVHALYDIGIVATSAPGGAKAVTKADWTPLAGKTAMLWPDNDDTGIEAMQTVKGILEGLTPPCTVHVIDPRTLGLPEKGDVVDFLDSLSDLSADDQRAAVLDVLEDALPDTPAEGVGKLLEDTISGKRRNIPFPWPAITRFARALFPKTLTAICGDPGTTKSYFILEAVCRWHQEGVKVAIYELEEDRAYHLHRALAFLAGNAKLLDDEWVRANPEAVREQYETWRASLDLFGACMDDAPDRQITLADLTKWVERKASDGCEIIAIDPVTAAATEQRPWEADLRFVMDMKTIARRHGCRIIVVTHPKKGRSGKGNNMAEMSGGAAYERFPQSVFWIRSMNPSETVTVATALGHIQADANRIIRIGKARNGRGQGLDLAYTFSGDTLRFAEHGILVEGK